MLVCCMCSVVCMNRGYMQSYIFQVLQKYADALAQQMCPMSFSLFWPKKVQFKLNIYCFLNFISQLFSVDSKCTNNLILLFILPIKIWRKKNSKVKYFNKIFSTALTLGPIGPKRTKLLDLFECKNCIGLQEVGRGLLLVTQTSTLWLFI